MLKPAAAFFAAALALAGTALAQNAATTSPIAPDIPAAFTPPTASYDYVKREVMIPMRDGVKLYTVIVIPKGAKDAPIMLTRTPYNASDRGSNEPSAHLAAVFGDTDAAGALASAVDLPVVVR